jgi:hypothetical protein
LPLAHPHPGFKSGTFYLAEKRKFLFCVDTFHTEVKDLVFPEHLQEIMNRVLVTERLSQAQLVEARTKGEVQRIEAHSRRRLRNWNPFPVRKGLDSLLRAMRKLKK